MRVQVEMSCKSVGDILGIKENTARELSRRALEKIRRRLVIMHMIDSGLSNREIISNLPLSAKEQIEYLRDVYKNSWCENPNLCYTTDAEINVAAKLNGHRGITI